ncbi:MAG: Hsp20/alpha crystallin family protein [Gammaproteobacteria bacterium]|jgi:HSP20 family protein
MTIGKDISNLLRELTGEFYGSSSWRPRADVYRCSKGWLVKLELAGVAREDLRVVVHQDALVVEGRRRDWCIPDTQAPLSMEITYDWFRRTIRLSAPIDTESIRTEYRDGMLLVRLLEQL